MRMTRVRVLTAAVLPFLLACSGGQPVGAPTPSASLTPSESGGQPSGAPTPQETGQQTGQGAQLAPDLDAVSVSWRRVAGGLAAPTEVTSAPDGLGRMFVVEKGGVVRIFQKGSLRARPYLNLSAVVSTSSERGLLSMAFPRDFRSNPRLFVLYTRADGDIVLARMRAKTARSSHVAASTRKPLLRIEHSTYGNHNGGQLVFGPDGMLYMSVGDGGGGGDPLASGQDRSSLKGKVLRLDVSCGKPYCVPRGNPFAGAKPGRGEIWLTGLRNPWRMSFDRATKALWIGDVGQDRWEEVNRVSANPRYRNLGWSCREGRSVYNASRCRSSVHYVGPKTVLGRSAGQSITGGFVYRGSRFRSLLAGAYVFGDYVTRGVWLYAPGQGKRLQSDRLGPGEYQGPTSFGEDDARELWAVTYDGVLWRMRAKSR